ncbi:hypothetical protein [Herbidospora cretacea]|uniref:hypothetical protein n=1 Tax=Herbidospora cretacea TaxID=28444 RepID=UPI0012FA24E6|nr:hypothetical protein [Herbidospora cretacea]
MIKYIVSLAVLGAGLFALPAQAQAQAGGCGAQLDTRKGVSSVVWRLCLEDGDRPHGALSADCRIAAPFWISVPCSVRGRFEIQRNGDLVVSGPFSAVSGLDGHLDVDQIFSFGCQGPGVYAFAVKDARYTFPALNSVAAPDAFVALNACPG